MRRTWWGIALALLMLLAGFAGSTSHDEILESLPCPADVTAWLLFHAIPLETTHPQALLRDLEPLRRMLDGASIVGLGEQTHGTREFFEMKHRIFRFLVEEMGFRVLAFEADWLALQELNECLLPGGPPIEEAFEKLGYWIWQTEEVLALLSWIREFNSTANGDDPVHFVGVDRLLGAEDVASTVEGYLRRVDPSAADRFAPLLAGDLARSWDRLRVSGTSGNGPADHAALIRESVFVLDPLIGWMNANAARCIAASSPQEYALTLRTLELTAAELARLALPKGEEPFFELDSWSSLERDRMMAQNVSWWLQFLGETKAAIWAHNGHVARSLSTTDVFLPMGSFLHATYGDAYVSIGFSFAEGIVSAIEAGPRVQTVIAGPLVSDCYEVAFQTVGSSRFIVDLRDLESGSVVSEWMNTERAFRMIGSSYGLDDPGWDYPLILPASFDILIHIETSTPSTPWRGL